MSTKKSFSIKPITIAYGWKKTQNNYRYISLKTLIAKKSIARCNKYNTYFYITKFIDSLLYIVIYVYIYCQTLSSTPANVPVLLPIPSNAVNSGAGGARTHLPMFSDQERIKPSDDLINKLGQDIVVAAIQRQNEFTETRNAANKKMRDDGIEEYPCK